jgi:hypothetical protein
LGFSSISAKLLELDRSSASSDLFLEGREVHIGRLELVMQNDVGLDLWSLILAECQSDCSGKE